MAEHRGASRLDGHLIRVLQVVRSEIPVPGPRLMAKPGEYTPWVNQHWAVSVEINGELLGLYPAEFAWVTGPPAGWLAAMEQAGDPPG